MTNGSALNSNRQRSEEKREMVQELPKVYPSKQARAFVEKGTVFYEAGVTGIIRHVVAETAQYPGAGDAHLLLDTDGNTIGRGYHAYEKEEDAIAAAIMQASAKIKKNESEIAERQTENNNLQDVIRTLAARLREIKENRVPAV
jgi:hypothetical protein